MIHIECEAATNILTKLRNHPSGSGTANPVWCRIWENIEGPVHLETAVALDQWQMVMDGVIIPEMEVSLTSELVCSAMTAWYTIYTFFDC